VRGWGTMWGGGPTAPIIGDGKFKTWCGVTVPTTKLGVRFARDMCHCLARGSMKEPKKPQAGPFGRGSFTRVVSSIGRGGCLGRRGG